MSGAETLLAFATTWIAALMLPTSVRGRGMVLLLLTNIGDSLRNALDVRRKA